MKHSTIAFLAGCINIPMLIVNIIWGSWTSLISIVVIVICWWIALWIYKQEKYIYK